jgi:hypothetical protein
MNDAIQTLTKQKSAEDVAREVQEAAERQAAEEAAEEKRKEEEEKAARAARKAALNAKWGSNRDLKSVSQDSENTGK